MTTHRLPTRRHCIMCGGNMVEVRRSVVNPLVQDWQCPRCLHTEHDVYEEDSANAKPEQGH